MSFKGCLEIWAERCGLVKASEHSGALIDFPGITMLCPGASDIRLSILISSRLSHIMWFHLFIATGRVYILLCNIKVSNDPKKVQSACKQWENISLSKYNNLSLQPQYITGGCKLSSQITQAKQVELGHYVDRIMKQEWIHHVLQEVVLLNQ